MKRIFKHVFLINFHAFRITFFGTSNFRIVSKGGMVVFCYSKLSIWKNALSFQTG